nr:ER lumen protein-retaining receptor erd-2.2-like isoform X1 [Arachis hypogaea]
MGKKRGSEMNILFGWLMKLSIKVKIFLGTLVALCALVALGFTIKDHEYFFVVAEAVHLAGTIVLLYKLFTKKTCSGLSLKTQEITALYLSGRLICGMLLRNVVGIYMYIMLDLVFLLSTLLTIWKIRFKLKSSYIKELDTVRVPFMVVSCAILAIIIHPRSSDFSFTNTLWAFCVYLEAISVFPQLRFMQNAKMVETFTGYYVFSLGISRFLALAQWIIQIYKTRGTYLFLLGSGNIWFLAALLAEMVQSFILADFCYYYIKRQIGELVSLGYGSLCSFVFGPWG